MYHKNVEDRKEKLHDDAERVMEFSHLDDRLNSGGCEAAVTSRIGIGWVKFREYQDFVFEKISSHNHRNCIQKLCEISNAL